MLDQGGGSDSHLRLSSVTRVAIAGAGRRIVNTTDKRIGAVRHYKKCDNNQFEYVSHGISLLEFMTRASAGC